MKKVLACLATGAALLSAPAFAQTADSSFTGPRVEAILGWDKTKAGSTIDNDNIGDASQSMDGLLYGVGVGYDVDFGSAVIGAEAEFSDSTAKTEFANFGLGDVKAGRDIYVGARAGFKAAPSTLVYVKGGYTNARFKAYDSFNNVTFNEKIDTDGWRIGAGVEQKVGSNAFAKLEYRYSNYSKGEVDFGDNIPESNRFDVDLDRHQVVAGVGVRF